MSRFQGSTAVFDDIAAEVLALDRRDVPCMTLLLLAGPASADELASALHARRSSVLTTIERLQSTGYARTQRGGGERIELTEQARKWIEGIWMPVRKDGSHLFDQYPMRQLELISEFLRHACDIQEGRMRRLRAWLTRPSSLARRSPQRGGLSPAALRRVHVFVEANLAHSIHLSDLAARAALSPYHFARAFKTSMRVTPRAYVEQRRIERARHLLRDSTLSIADVAVESGLGTQSRLTSTFKRRTGVTPGEYRRGRTE